MKSLFFIFFLLANYAVAQFKTTFTHDVNGNRVANITTAQSGEVMSNVLSVQSLVGSQATFKWQTVPSASNYVYEYSSTPTRFSTNATSVAITIPTVDYFQFVVSNSYANNRCVVSAWKNLRTGTIQSIGNGDWHTPFSWDCNCIPTSLNITSILSGHTITIDGQNGNTAYLNLAGALQYLNTGSLGFGK
jgi:hypothetical protein